MNRFKVNGKDVVMQLRSLDELHIVATCYNEQWAQHIAELLSKHDNEDED